MPGDRAQILLRLSSCRLAFERTEVSARGNYSLRRESRLKAQCGDLLAIQLQVRVESMGEEFTVEEVKDCRPGELGSLITVPLEEYRF